MWIRFKPVNDNYKFSIPDFSKIAGKCVAVKASELVHAGDDDNMKCFVTGKQLSRIGAKLNGCEKSFRFSFYTYYREFELVRK